MILEVKQTKSNFKNEYEISTYGCLFCSARTSWISSAFSCCLHRSDENAFLQGRLDIATNLKNSIPLTWLFGSTKYSKVMSIINDCQEKIGHFCYETSGLFKSRYQISLEGKTFEAYSLSRGRFHYVSLYQGQSQIGLIEKSLVVYNNLDTYTIYLLDDFSDLSNIFALFVIYYDNWNYARRGQIAIERTQMSWEYTISQYRDRFNPNFLKENNEFN